MATERQTQEAIMQIDPKALKDSPFQPRKAYNPVTLRELADSVREKGILTPIVARQINGSTEIVFGHRRKRAAELAGVSSVPVIVREMTDVEAREAQIIENLQRDDLNPLDEANGYAELMKGGQKVEDISKKIGKSGPYVYTRLKLLDMVPEAQSLFRQGRIPVTLATFIARIPKDKQKKAAERVATKDGTDPLSFRSAVTMLRTEFKIGIPEEFDPVKEQAMEDQWQAAVKKAGESTPPVKVLGATETEKAFPYGSDVNDPSSGWARVDQVSSVDPDGKRSWEKILGKEIEGLTHAIARGPSGQGYDMVSTKEAIAAYKKQNDGKPEAPAAKGKKGKKSAATKAEAETTTESDPEAEKAAKEKRKVEVRKYTAGLLLARMTEKFSAKLDANRWRFIAQHTLANNGLPPVALKRRGKTLAEVTDDIAKMAEGDLRALVAESVCGNDIVDVKEGYSDSAKEAAKLLGLDLAKLEKDAKEAIEEK